MPLLLIQALKHISSNGQLRRGVVEIGKVTQQNLDTTFFPGLHLKPYVIFNSTKLKVNLDIFGTPQTT